MQITNRVDNVVCFSLHTRVAAKAHERDNMSRRPLTPPAGVRQKGNTSDFDTERHGWRESVPANVGAPTPAQNLILNNAIRNPGFYTYPDHMFMRYRPLSDSIFGDLIRQPFNKCSAQTGAMTPAKAVFSLTVEDDSYANEGCATVITPPLEP